MAALFGISGLFDAQKAMKAFSRLTHRETATSITCQTENLFFIHHLPQHNKDEKILVALDGKLSNSTELCIALQVDFLSDVEVILAAYKKWGAACITHLHGMFAIAILDDETLYLFRDRFGQKPLFYLQTSEAFLFASQIKSLVPFLDKVELNQDALMSYLSFLAPTPPHTFFKNIYKLAAGEYLCFTHNKITTKRYYDLLD
ncbi:MAG: asparagine synthetase B, partial [Sulfurimonadaceae bacterium]|nr:asparagine synthetase B [Sulfurimonadaceae bacterium]